MYNNINIIIRITTISKNLLENVELVFQELYDLKFGE